MRVARRPSGSEGNRRGYGAAFHDDRLAKELRERGLGRAQRFRWDRAARVVQHAIRQAIDEAVHFRNQSTSSMST